jgi:putative membrane protein
MKKLLVVSLVLPLLLTWTLVSAQDPGEGYRTGSWMMNWGFGVCWFIPVIILAFWIVFIVGVIYFIRRLIWSSKGGEIKSEETPLDILKRRYAKGEITKEDFDRIKKDIS